MYNVHLMSLQSNCQEEFLHCCHLFQPIIAFYNCMDLPFLADLTKAINAAFSPIYCPKERNHFLVTSKSKLLEGNILSYFWIWSGLEEERRRSNLALSMEMSSVHPDSDLEIMKQEQEGKKQKSRLQKHAPSTLQLDPNRRRNCSLENQNSAIPLLSPLTLTPSLFSVEMESTYCTGNGINSGEEGTMAMAGNRLHFAVPGQEWWSPASPIQKAEPFPLFSLVQNSQ